MPKTVTLRGTAEDAKAGAVLVSDDGNVVYIEGLSSWPEEVFRKRVIAKGRLVRKKYIPDPVNDNGEICQGAEGEQTVLEDPLWELAGKPGAPDH